jgi:hypothetical protein
MDEKKWKEILSDKAEVEEKAKEILGLVLLMLAKGEQKALSDYEAAGIKGRHTELGRFSALAGLVDDLGEFTNRIANEGAFLRRRAIRERLGAR